MTDVMTALFENDGDFYSFLACFFHCLFFRLSSRRTDTVILPARTVSNRPSSDALPLLWHKPEARLT
ncbi:hypothetical protein CBR_g12812 [Chara braunii]|uniref:Uncharacterized protein n=1 Tax=Chara braunii TaxID=69332 RepID=A0A388KSS4_CHABU|nr:hypothetical protein CBR_g12812 [Chara braunii]|eukprot:GBG73096.1 hypothetical protein CBR_g12812 [Chara braunii]